MTNASFEDLKSVVLGKINVCLFFSFELHGLEGGTNQNHSQRQCIKMMCSELWCTKRKEKSLLAEIFTHLRVKLTLEFTVYPLLLLYSLV